ncbi:hypothetical protein [Legionella drancourtii]|uniref:Lipoprotein n=1 Tax=Legionella drancourtii LLAP12 TaxID=658187 RepID=G9EUD0_9GAMM|nr:hypothetical protein [Legionella drancourtii]EHL29204.1 hypothetical protein LDG_8923 [Legionella drancourtii LLAP12]
MKKTFFAVFTFMLVTFLTGCIIGTGSGYSPGYAYSPGYNASYVSSTGYGVSDYGLGFGRSYNPDYGLLDFGVGY